MTPVLWATLTFDRTSWTHEATRDKHYQRWMSALARTTRCCVDAIAGYDDVQQHAHLKVRCKTKDVDKFYRRLPKFDVQGAWKHRRAEVEEWNALIASKDDAYIINKHQGTMFCGCANSSKPCRKGRCIYKKHNA